MWTSNGWNAVGTERREAGRPGEFASGFDYRKEDWTEHGIKARRFSPCPHCGSAVRGIERVWKRPGETQKTAFREATCVREGCGWHYFRTGGSREDFIEEANRRE